MSGNLKTLWYGIKFVNSLGVVYPEVKPFIVMGSFKASPYTLSQAAMVMVIGL